MGIRSIDLKLGPVSPQKLPQKLVSVACVCRLNLSTCLRSGGLWELGCLPLSNHLLSRIDWLFDQHLAVSGVENTGATLLRFTEILFYLSYLWFG